ncbi:Cysteine desulfurase IscS [Chlamydiales bacterium STE3]|nr:Cysteine desulfurase IscS [Chlamydiales bacterium STE3]
MKNKEKIYLDNNATTFLDPAVKEALTRLLEKPLGNPSSLHTFGQEARSLIEGYRRKVANYFAVRPHEIIFTSSGSESMNFLIKGYLEGLQSGHVITSNIEHSCVKKALVEHEKRGLQVTYLPTGLHGAIDPQKLKEAILPETRLIVLMAANNETGVKNDINQVADIARKASIPFVVDGVALLGKEPIAIPEGVVGMGFSGHKIHALPGVGVAFVKLRSKPKPLIYGNQEYGLRGGTENLTGIASFAQAIDLLDSDKMVSMAALRDRFENEIMERILDVRRNGLGPRISNTSNLSFAGVDGESFLIALDQEGIAASHGSACSAGALEPSPVLLNMGIPLGVVHSSIRFSLSRFTTEEEISRAVEVIERLVFKFRK